MFLMNLRLPAFSGNIRPIITMCSVWEWNGACNQFEFYDRELSIINSTVLYKWSTHTCNHEKQGDINSRTHLPLDDTYFAEVNCIPPSYDAWLNMVAPKALQQKSWNFGISIFNLESWRRKKMTPHYEELLQVNLRDHIFAETSLAFGLGISYLSFAGEVACLEDLNFTVLDGLVRQIVRASAPVFLNSVRTNRVPENK